MDPVLLYRSVGALAFSLYDATEWSWYHYAAWTGLMFGALQLLATLVLAGGHVAGAGHPTRAIRGAEAGRLEKFEAIDNLCITVNKAMTAMFTYQGIRYVWSGGDGTNTVAWASPITEQGSAYFGLPTDGPKANLLAAVVAISQVFLLYIVYDFVYTLFHWGLHHASIYRFVHKHHHRQCVPFRGNLDAVNVHPFEFAVGEWNHLWAARALAWALDVATGGKVHLWGGSFAVFVIAGGILASLNHTRFAAALPFGIYQVAYHDVHHARHAHNYGQYTMFWDHVFGTFRPHDDYDGVTGEKKVGSEKNKKQEEAQEAGAPKSSDEGAGNARRRRGAKE
jgi:sterol desaturase/sphingolipid hydroxylase (fatty acid hydroxylase superfamily)